MPDNLTNPNPQWQGTSVFAGHYLYFGQPNQDPVTNPKSVEDTDGNNLGPVIQLNQYGSPVQNINLPSPPYSYQLYTDLVGNGGAPVPDFQHPEFNGLSDVSAISSGFWEEAEDATTLETILIMALTGASVATTFQPTQLRIGDPSSNNNLFVPDGPNYKFNALFNNGEFNDEDLIVTQTTQDAFIQANSTVGFANLEANSAVGFSATVRLKSDGNDRLVLGFNDANDDANIQIFDETGALLGNIFTIGTNGTDLQNVILSGANAAGTASEPYIRFDSVETAIDFVNRVYNCAGGLVDVFKGAFPSGGVGVPQNPLFSVGDSLAGTQLTNLAGAGAYRLTFPSLGTTNYIVDVKNRQSQALIYSFSNYTTTSVDIFAINDAGAGTNFVQCDITISVP